MPATICVPPIRGTAMRLTRLNSCGVPVVGPCSILTTEGFITITMSPQYEEGTETTVKNAAGKLAINDRSPDVLKNWTVELALIGINPDALEMLAGYEALLDNDGNTVGVSYGETVSNDGTAIEIWTDIAGVSECAGGTQRYGYLVLPFTTGYRVTSDIVVQNDAVNATVQGLTKRGSQWGKGPHDVVLNGPGAGTAGPLLTDFRADEHMRFLTTTVDPPAIPDECGCEALA